MRYHAPALLTVGFAAMVTAALWPEVLWGRLALTYGGAVAMALAVGIAVMRGERYADHR